MGVLFVCVCVYVVVSVLDDYMGVHGCFSLTVCVYVSECVSLNV